MTKDSTNLTTNDKSVNGVLGIRTRGGRMVVADESTELWRRRATLNLIKRKWAFFGLFSYFHLSNSKQMLYAKIADGWIWTRVLYVRSDHSPDCAKFTTNKCSKCPKYFESRPMSTRPRPLGEIIVPPKSFSENICWWPPCYNSFSSPTTASSVWPCATKFVSSTPSVTKCGEIKPLWWNFKCRYQFHGKI